MDYKINQFAKGYKAETSASKRRNMCLEAVDEGLIARGASIKIVDRLFGTDFANDFIGSGENEGHGAVYFSSQPHQDGFNQVAPVGWYLYVSWDKTRTILDYGLTNLHK